MTVRRQLDEDMKPLGAMLVKMVDLVDEQFANAVQSLLNRDLELAEQVVKRDDMVDALELKIDDDASGSWPVTSLWQQTFA